MVALRQWCHKNVAFGEIADVEHPDCQCHPPGWMDVMIFDRECDDDVRPYQVNPTHKITLRLHQ